MQSLLRHALVDFLQVHPAEYIPSRLRVFFYFYFLISNKDVYSKTLPHVESHKAEKRLQEKKIKKEIKDTNYKGES